MKKILMFSIIINSLVFSQSDFGNFISNIYQTGSQSDKAALIDSFMTANQPKGFPYIEDSTAYFIYRGEASKVSIAGDFNGWSPDLSLSRVSGTNFWYKGHVFEMNARLDYKIVINDQSWYLDPLNPNTCSGGYGPNSELAMPDYVQPPEILRNENIDHGAIERISVTSSVMNRSYRVDIYLPPGYEASEANYPSAYINDGSEYLDLGYAANVIDNLLNDNKITPFIGVFVTPTNRGDEYAYNNRFNYAEFIAEELVPQIDSLYKTSRASEDRLIMGTSFGANISGLISYNYPNVFGNCGLHSAAFWVNDLEVYNYLTASDQLNTIFYAAWGTYESVYQYMRPFKNELLNKGYEFGWAEYPEGHSWGLWRATFDDMIIFFFPSGYTSLYQSNQVPTQLKLHQNYPNPFNPETTIEFEIPSEKKISTAQLKIYNIAGMEVENFQIKNTASGNHKVIFDGKNLASGVYFYSLKTPYAQLTKKMILIK